MGVKLTSVIAYLRTVMRLPCIASPIIFPSGGQEILAGFSADETGGGDGPRITSSCHCSSTVSSR